MRITNAMSAALMAALLGGAPALAQAPARTVRQASHLEADVPTGRMVLATVRLARAVEANADRLAAGTYRVQLAGDPLKPAVGQTPNLEQWVEFLQGQTVKGRAVASIVPGDRIRAVADGPIPSSGGSRVETLKGNDYVRIWINKGGNSYLIHLPIAS